MGSDRRHYPLKGTPVLALVLLGGGLLGLLGGGTPEGVAASVVTPSQDLTLSVTCLPGKSLSVPRNLHVQLQVAASASGARMLSAEVASEVGEFLPVQTAEFRLIDKISHADLLFEGPRMEYRTFCATEQPPAVERYLRGRLLKASEHSIFHFRSAGGERVISAQHNPLLSLNQLKAVEGTVRMGKEAPNPYQLRLVRNISISAPPQDTIEVEFLVD